MVTIRISKNCFAAWPTVLACCFPLLLILLWSGPFGLAFVGAPILFVIWACAALVALAIAIFSARDRRWRHATSMIVLPLLTLAVIASAGTVWDLAIDTGERFHFEIMRRSYLEDIAKLPPSDEPHFAEWNWGGFVVGHAVVYDESDEIVLPQPSAAWKKRVADTDIGMCGVWGTPLGDHFYLVRIGC
jgi:hypothetical protein